MKKKKTPKYIFTKQIIVSQGKKYFLINKKKLDSDKKAMQERKQFDSNCKFKVNY